MKLKKNKLSLKQYKEALLISEWIREEKEKDKYANYNKIYKNDSKGIKGDIK